MTAFYGRWQATGETCERGARIERCKVEIHHATGRYPDECELRCCERDCVNND